MSANQNVSATFNTVPPPPTHPSCTLHAVGNRVALKARHHAKPRTLRLTVTCDQSALVKLTGKLTSVPKAKKGKKPPKAKTFRIRALSAQAAAGTPLTLTVQLPAAAIKRGRHDSASFTLSATNANGASTATAAIRKLVLV